MRTRTILLLLTLLTATRVAAQVDTTRVDVFDRDGFRITVSAQAAGETCARETQTTLVCRAFRGDTIRYTATVVDTVNGENVTAHVSLRWRTDDPGAVALDSITGIAVVLNRRTFRVTPAVVRLLQGVGFILGPGVGDWSVATERAYQVAEGMYAHCVYWRRYDTGDWVGKSSRWMAMLYADGRVDDHGESPLPCPDGIVPAGPLPVLTATQWRVVQR